MSIRWQNIMAIVPIFLAAGVAAGWLRLKSDEQEMLWGFREQSAGVATAVASFLDGARFEEVGKSGSADAALLDKQLQSMFHAGNARQIFGLSLDGQRVIFNAAPAEARKVRPMADPEALEAARAGESFITDLRTDIDGGTRLIAFAPVKNREGQAAGLVGVVVNADAFTRAWSESVRQASWLCAGATGLGLLVALGISSVFCARLRELKRAADKLAQGTYSERLEPGLVRELSDLSDTFNTVGSILEELAAKSRQCVVEAEQFRTDEDLRGTFASHCFPPCARSAGKGKAAGRLANDHCVGDFFELFESDEGTYALLGRVDEAPLAERMVLASAANAMSRELLRTVGAEEACRRVRDNFPITHWECVLAEKAGGKVRHWKLRSDGALECRERASMDAPAVFHSLSPEAAKNVELYIASVPGIGAEELLREIGPILRNEKRGAAIILGEFREFSA